MAGKDLIERGEQRRSEMLAFIRDYTERHGFSPTMTEIGSAVGIASPNAVRNHLVRLQEDGLLTMQPRTARSIRLIDDDELVGG